MRRTVLAICLMLVAGAAKAAPGVGEKVYGATLEAGVTEVEARYGRLTGGAADGEDGLVLEVAHSFSDRFYGGALIELEREPGGDREVEAFGLEGIVTLGRIEALALDVAVYGEYELVREGTDAIELKTLLEHEAGPFDARLNLIAEKHLDSGDAFEFGYAASADWAVVGEIRAGLQAFGEFGELDHFGGRNEHYLGPVIKAEIEHLPGGSELEIETGWLKALGAADDETDGQFRLLLEWETRF